MNVFILIVPGGSSFVDQFCYLCFMSAMPCCLVCFLQPCGHLLGKDCHLGSFVCDIFFCFVTFPYGVLGPSGI